MPNTANQPFTDRPQPVGQQVVETPVRARAGVTGQGVRGVLIWSTLGVIVLLALVYWYSFT
jgi:hypothetical protein